MLPSDDGIHLLPEYTLLSTAYGCYHFQGDRFSSQPRVFLIVVSLILHGPGSFEDIRCLLID